MARGCYPRPTVEERFTAAHNRGGKDECWEWQAARSTKGYGLFSVQNCVRKAHRVAWQLEHGEIPEGMHVLHSCDNRACVNPAHLFLGTNDDNVADMVAKDRQSKGTHRPASKLSDTDVTAIRNSHETQIALAAKYGVSQSTISAIRGHKKWKHL